MIFFSKIQTFLFFFLAIPLLTFPVYAQNDSKFDTSYKVSYEVSPAGQTTVTQNIVLKNRTPNFYADKFELKIGSTKVEDVQAKDNTGSLETEVKFENNLTTIAVKFSQKVIGIDKSLPLTLSYKSHELAAKSGQIWEISIPKLAKSDEITEYLATVIVPKNMGSMAFSVPEPKSSSNTGIVNLYTFEKDQLNQSGIAMSFGEKQVFSFSFDYYLENRNLTSQRQELALPPDNNYQKLVYTKIDPPPLDVEVDNDNNFLAKYRLLPKQSIKVKVEGYVEVFSKPFRNIYSQLSDEEKKKYTQAQKYWEIDNAQVRELAQKFKNPKEIYKFTSENTGYSKERLNQKTIERKGAAAALLNPKDSICMEFTDLFIAIARSAGIPAREVEGYAYTQNERLRPLSLALNSGDVLHAWPEFWDDNLGWVQVDPTWGATSGGLDYFEKLDFNHIAFVHRGENSAYPLPAGSYKKPTDLSTKSVSIEFSDNLPSATSIPTLKITSPQKILPVVPVAVRAQIQNEGTSSILNGELSLSSNILKNLGSFETPQSQEKVNRDTVKINILPPYANRSYVFRLQSTQSWRKKTGNLILSFNEVQISTPVEIVPIYNLIFLKSLLISLVIAALIIVSGLVFYKKTYKKHRRRIF